MSRIAHFLMSQDSLQGFSVSPRNALAVLFGLGVGILALLFTNEFVVISAGLIGTAAGYALYNISKVDNPVATLRPIWKIRRIHVIFLGSLASACIALALFLQSIGVFGERSDLSVAYTAGAYGFFAFSVSSYLFGRQCLSKARRRLAKASVEQTHEWQLQDDANRQRGFWAGA